MNYGYLRYLKELPKLARYRSFAIVGNDDYFKQDALLETIRTIRKQFAIDEERFDGSDKKLRISEVDEALCEYPLIGKFRLVVVSNADKIKELKSLEYWFKEPTLDTRAIFVFTEEVKRPQFEFEITCVASDMGPDSKEFDKYLEHCLEGTDKKLTEQAKEHMKHVFANSVFLIKNELLKAAAYVHPIQVIDKPDLEKTLASYPMAKVFDLVDLLLSKKQKSAIVVLEDLMEQGTDGTFLIHLMTQRLQLMQSAVKARDRGENIKDFFITKKLPLFQLGSVLDGLRLVKGFHIARYFDMLCEYEAKLRLKQGDDNHQRLTMESMVVEMCR